MKQRGSALITALFIMAIVAIAATAMAIRLQIDIRRTNLTLSADRRYALAQGVAYWAMGVLIDNQKEKKPDPLEQGFPAEDYLGAKVSGQILDMQSRFNLNALASNDKKQQADAIEGFTRLITLVAPKYEKQAKTIALATTEWVSRHNIPGVDTRDFYNAVKPPYQVAHRMMASISELRLVAGVTADLYQKLLKSKVIFAIPNNNNQIVNFNTAPKEVLMASQLKLTSALAEQFINERRQKGSTGFKNASESTIEIKGVPRSQYFLVHARVELDKITQDVFTLLQRHKTKNKVITVWESRGTI